MTTETTWVTGLYHTKKKGPHGPYYLIIAVTDNSERRKIFVDEEHYIDIAHFLHQIDKGQKPRIPIIPKRNNKGWHVNPDLVDTKEPDKKQFANPNNALLVKQLTFKQDAEINLKVPKIRQSFKIHGEYAAKAEVVAKKANMHKTDLYAKAVEHYLRLDDCANSVGI